MKLALVPPEKWETLNDQLKAHFALPEEQTVRAYKGMAHAAFECVQGAAQFLPHKRSLAAVKGQTPYFEPLLPHFYKEMYQVQTVRWMELTDVRAWVETLKKDTGFVLFAEDHPVTAELYPYDQLDEVLNEKKILSLRISHFNHFYKREALRPYSVRLCCYDNDFSLAFIGERFKAAPLMAAGMDWQPTACMERVKNWQVSRQEPEHVRTFENAFPGAAEPWFKNEVPRLYDRVLLKFPQVSAEALLQRLYDRLAVPPHAYSQSLDTTNLCRWNSTKTFSTWWDPKPAEADLASLLVIDSGWLVTKDFANTLKSAYEEIKAEQSW